MLYQITGLLTDALSSVSYWFGQIFQATGATPFYISILFVSLSIRYLIFPLLGNGIGSDRVSKSKKGGEEK